MSLAEANLSLPDNFTGVVKVFPLPDLVLFPGVIQPLHIFEPRYRRMLQDALAGDELIGIAKLKPNWEVPSDKHPAIHSMMCIGKIVTHAKLQDGRYNLLLLGAQRAKIVRELPSQLPYRMAEVELAPGETESNSAQYRGPIRQHVMKLFRKLVERDEQLNCESAEHLLSDELPFGLLLDLITFSSGVDLGAQQSVLETTDVLARANKVIGIIERKLRGASREELVRFPPAFSPN